jgi:hypothetical protein
VAMLKTRGLGGKDGGNAFNPGLIPCLRLDRRAQSCLYQAHSAMLKAFLTINIQAVIDVARE